jgi:DNA-binding transcriptional ArsR family regulator
MAVGTDGPTGPGTDARHRDAPVPGEREAAVLAALADGTRRRLLAVLVEVGSGSATTLADRLPVSRQAVIKHLRVLQAAGLVGGARSGREVLYAARPDPLEASARWLADLCSTWRSSPHVAASEGAADSATHDLPNASAG